MKTTMIRTVNSLKPSAGSTFDPIPLNRPPAHDSGLEHLALAFRAGNFSGDGPYTHRCEAFIESTLPVGRALLTTSCTSALEMAMLLLDVGPGDEVIVPSFTFVSCANAVVLRGARPIFADIDPLTLSLSVATIEPLLTERTKAVMVVHYGGSSSDIASIARMLAKRGVALVEDAAHAFLARSEGRALGTFGQLATFSFHETKNFSMGEGGALVMSDPVLLKRAEILREKGTDRKQFFQGLVDKYSWVDVGSSFVPSDLLAAILWSQLERAEALELRRAQVWGRYFDELAEWASDNGVNLPQQVVGSAHHTFHLLTPTGQDRKDFIGHMRTFGIQTPFHYLPLEQSPFGQKYAQRPCPVSTRVSETLARLPIFQDISDDEVERVIEAAQKFRPAFRS
jgi:dTDP-4-amino-4,6-dideoxygalactose transaminase